MVSASGRYVIVFNGEIYNHLQLRHRLGVVVTMDAKQLAVDSDPSARNSWRGHSDTETLLACVERWGLERTLQEIEGMFAFALWDRVDRTLHVARDRIGEKPIYFGYVGGRFVVASEVSALVRLPDFEPRIDRGALALLMRYGYVSAPACIYEGLSKLPPGTFLSIRAVDAARGHHPSQSIYWSAFASAEAGAARPLTFEDDGEAIDTLEETLRAAIRGQMLSDVPIGAFLSGGVDSSAVVSLMQAEAKAAGADAVRTFTIGFQEGAYDEATAARAVAMHLGTRHTEMYMTAEDCMAVIPRLPQLYSEPFADSSQIATYLVAQLARRDVTVALSGDAGDELFGGYNRHVVAMTTWPRVARLPLWLRRGMANALDRIPAGAIDATFAAIAPLMPVTRRVRLPIEKARKLAALLGSEDAATLYRRLTSRWDGRLIVRDAIEPRTAAAGPWPALPSLSEQMMALDLVTFLPEDVLVKLDRAAMGVSLESRVPMLDRAVIDFAARLPLHYKVRGGEGKWLLRQVLYRHVPRSIVNRPKMGFTVPVGVWLRGPLREWAESLLEERQLRGAGYFDAKAVRDAWDEHLSGRRDMHEWLWPVLVFQDWIRQ
jgi:asparagine synthase (glutamine-hydrolysing)